jgi:hypothetical protein
MIDQTTLKRREMLLVASAMLAATTISSVTAAAQTQPSAGSKSEPASPGSAALPDEPQTSASRGRRAS